MLAVSTLAAEPPREIKEITYGKLSEAARKPGAVIVRYGKKDGGDWKQYERLTEILSCDIPVHFFQIESSEGVYGVFLTEAGKNKQVRDNWKPGAQYDAAFAKTLAPHCRIEAPPA